MQRRRLPKLPLILLLALAFALRVPITSDALTAPRILLGNSSIASLRDKHAGGSARAFRFAAVAAGRASFVSVYVDRSSTAKPLVVGVYTSKAGHPDALLASGRRAIPRDGGWNQVTLIPSPPLKAGANYWIAVLGGHGTLSLRDRHRGTRGCSEISFRRNLKALPSSWRRRGATLTRCSLSAYVSVAKSSRGRSAPANTGLPSVSGRVAKGQLLTATTGNWSNSPTSFAYQWQHCDSSGSSCVDIAGATARRYTLVASDVERTVRVVVRATNAAGSASAVSAATATVSSDSISRFPDVGIAAGADLQSWSASDLDRELDDYLNLHAHWIRHDFAWDAIESQQGVFNWSGFDQLVSAARARSLNLIATLSYTPAWANGGHSDHAYQPTSADQFGQFAGKVAARYASQGVHTYEIWNEPNIGFWKPAANPAYYTAVLCSAYHYIHAADAQAVVLTGGTSPAGDSATTLSPQTWLKDLYADGAAPCFDAVAHHPYVDSSSTPSDLGNAWDLMYDAYPPSNLRAIMSAHGDAAKRVWATEVGCNRVALGETECSDRMQEAFRLWQGYSWAGGLCWFTYWDPNVYGLVDGNWGRRPQWYAYRAAASAFQ